MEKAGIAITIFMFLVLVGVGYYVYLTIEYELESNPDIKELVPIGEHPPSLEHTVAITLVAVAAISIIIKYNKPEEDKDDGS